MYLFGNEGWSGVGSGSVALNSNDMFLEDKKKNHPLMDWSSPVSGASDIEMRSIYYILKHQTTLLSS